MSKHKKHHKSNKVRQEEQQHLPFEEAKTMTVEEAVRQDNHNKVGISEGDGVLDRYIKQHREKIGAKKFDTQSVTLDTQTLDNFIKKQREAVEAEGLLEETEDTEVVILDPVESIQDPIKQLEQEEMDSVFWSQPEPLPRKTSKKGVWLLLGATALVAGFVVGGYWLSNRVPHEQASQTTVKPRVVEKDTKKLSNKDREAFEDLYASFFVDAARTQLKNERFSHLSELESALKILEKTDYYTTAKTQFDRLSKQIEVINKINGQFANPVIVDGAKIESDVADTANFDQLGSDVLNTGNPNLDSLIQSVISEGRKQQAKKAEEVAATQQAQAKVASQATGNVSATPQANSGAVQTGGVVLQGMGSNSEVVSYGITNYDSANLQRHLSRVPYNQDALVDSNNSAWIFGGGVLERILSTSRSRGYISGNDFILERVNIVNGNGYYNMFKPDGTYLFSINAKTGYFVGNGKGYADDLDY